MKLPEIRLRPHAALALLLPLASTLVAQSVAPSSNSREEETIELSPFTVSSSRDIGFVAASSLAGGRLSTELKDTPLAYSVITREFLDALNLFDTEEALAWSVGAYQPYSDVTNYRYFNNEAGSSIMSRGIQTTRPQRNYFLLGVNSDTYSEDRIDFARGPNALLIGTTGLGGSVVTMTKRARTDKNFGRITATVGSWGKMRGAFDYNQTFGDRFGVRVNLLKQEADSWRALEFDERDGIHLAATFKVFPKTTLRAEYERYKNDVNLGRESVEDRVSGWDGVTVAPAPRTTIANASARGLATVGSATSPWLVYIPGEDTGTVMNWATTWKTLGGGANASVPVAGRLPLSTSNLGVDGASIIGNVYDPAVNLALALSGSQLALPTRGTVTGPTTPTLVYEFDDLAVYLEHQQGDHLFFEIAAHSADTSKLSNYIVAREINEILVDVNETLPTGAPNPNFLRPYAEALNSLQYFDNDYDEIRAALAAVFNGTRWGDFRGNIIAGRTESVSRTYRMTDVLERNADIRRRSQTDVYRYRYYFHNPAPIPTPESLAVVDPIAGTTTSYDVGTIVDLNSTTNNRGADTEYDYVQLALNAKLFEGRLNLLAGARRDSYLQHDRSVIGNAAALFNDYPVDWDGRTLYFRPTAPSDYYELTYVPKNSSGTPTGPAAPALSRPRSNGVPLAQYAGDRFRDDFSAPDVDFTIDTVTYGGVFTILPWLSVYANYAETYVPPRSGLTLTGDPVPAGVGDGWDAGLRFNLLEGRIVASIGIYDGSQSNNSFDSSGNTRKYADIVAANVVGDQSPNGSNTRGLALIPTPTFDFSDREASGFEIDLVANITPDWRMTFNYSDPETFTTNSRQDEWAYLNMHESTLRQIVLDAGGLVDGDGTATVDTSVPEAQRSPDVAAAVAGWNNIQTFKRTNDPTIRSFSNLPSFTANFYTDYRFTRGWLKNVRLGGGVQYFGDRVIGNRGADTMIDPANPNRAIDDPTVDIDTRILNGAYYTVTGTIGYERRLSDRSRLTVNVSIGNLLGDDDPIFIGTALRPPGGDIMRPDRVATPVNILYQRPRSWTVSAAVSF
jgi:outer membrane receptor protein involved in Fe transport